jgi:GNAT superfamily N-acetyltransferase
MNLDVYDKLDHREFDLEFFMKKYNYNHDDDYVDFKLSKLEDIDGIILENLFVKEQFRGQGYGKKIVEELKKQGKPIILYSVWDEHTHKFWELQGFKEWEKSENIYTWGL